MYITGKRFTKEFLQNNPTVLGTMLNKQGQTITFLEHPLKGDEAPIYAQIDIKPHLLINTEFYETDDMMADHLEYTPAFDGDLLKMSADF